jgi:hypothetical protein
MTMTLILIVVTVLAVGTCGSAHVQRDVADSAGLGIAWLGALPPDEFYRTRSFRMSGDRGLIVSEKTIFSSDDGGGNWKVRWESPGGEGANTVSDAWQSSAGHLLILSGGELFDNSAAGSAWRQMDTPQGGARYLAILGDRNPGRIILAGSESVSISAERSAGVPKYAQDFEARSPRMLIPAIVISRDNGRTWQRIHLPKATGYLAGLGGSGLNVVAWGPYAVYVSTDGGGSWKLMQMNASEHDDQAYPVAGALAGDRVYVSLQDGRLLTGPITGSSLSAIARLTSPLGRLTLFNACAGFAVSSADKPDVHQEEDVLMETRDGGKTWTPILRTRRIVALTMDGAELYGASFDRVFRIHVTSARASVNCGF